MKQFNLGLRFLLELVLLVSVGYGVFQSSAEGWRWIFSLGAALLIAIIWGIWIAPHSKRRLSDPSRLALEVLLFVSGVTALWLADQQLVAALFAGAVIVNMTLMLLWSQR